MHCFQLRHSCSRKNPVVNPRGRVTVKFVLMTVGTFVTTFQAEGRRLVVCIKLNPTALVGHKSMMELVFAGRLAVMTGLTF